MPSTSHKEYVEHKIIDRLAGENPSLKDATDAEVKAFMKAAED